MSKLLTAHFFLCNLVDSNKRYDADVLRNIFVETSSPYNCGVSILKFKRRKNTFQRQKKTTQKRLRQNKLVAIF